MKAAKARRLARIRFRGRPSLREREFWGRLKACMFTGEGPGRAARKHAASYNNRCHTWGPNAW